MATHPARLDEKSGADSLCCAAIRMFAAAQASPANMPTARPLPEINLRIVPPPRCGAIGLKASHLRRQLLQKLRHIRLPERGAQVGEMAVGFLARRDQHISGIGDALDLAFCRGDLWRVGLVVA